MFCLNGLMIQKLQGIIAFWGKIKIKNKISFNATSIFCNVLESYLSIYILRVVQVQNLEKSVTSCPHQRDSLRLSAQFDAICENSGKSNQCNSVPSPCQLSLLSFHIPFRDSLSTMLAPLQIKSKTDEHSQIHCLQTSSFLGRNAF